MEPEGSLPCSLQPTTGPYPETDESVHAFHPTSLRSIITLSSHLRKGLPSDLLIRDACSDYYMFSTRWEAKRFSLWREGAAVFITHWSRWRKNRTRETFWNFQVCFYKERGTQSTSNKSSSSSSTKFASFLLSHLHRLHRTRHETSSGLSDISIRNVLLQVHMFEQRCPSRLVLARSQLTRSVHSLSYGLYDRGSIPDRITEGIFAPPCPDQLWGLTSLLSKEYLGFFPLGQSGRGVKVTTRQNVVAQVKNSWICTSTPQYVFMSWCSI
jgi:hypothetical protein